MAKFLALIFLLSFQIIPHFSYSQESSSKEITLEGIWEEGTFRSRSVPGFRFMNDGRHYTRKSGQAILRYDIVSGELVDTVLNAQGMEGISGFNDYAFSDDESLILLASGREMIYRRSSRAFAFIYNRKEKTLTGVAPGEKVMHATLSPNGKAVAYVLRNNLYRVDLASGETHQVTSDGEENAIINGSADWVYEEEFSFTKAFEWSPDSKRLAFYRFDEREVPEFTMTNYTGQLYPEYETFKYPKVGAKNSYVEVHIHDISSGKTTKMDVDSAPDGYIPRIKWTSNPAMLCIFKMNRHQNLLELHLADASAGMSKLLMKEDNKYFVEIHDNLTFLQDGSGFLWTSEKEGWNQIYLYGMDGKVKKKLTEGAFDVTEFYGYNPSDKKVYYQAAAKSPNQREIYSVDLEGKRAQVVNSDGGWADASFSGTFDYYTINHSSMNKPPVYTVYEKGGKKVRTLEDNEELKKKQKEYGVSEAEFFSFNSAHDVNLKGWMIKPPDFDEEKEYPVFMYLYGGPGSQQVRDRWMGDNYWWFQMLASQGYIVACVDNRGTGGRGEEFRKMTYMQLGHYETIDQIDAAKYLGGLDYADPSRISIFGWSYGGYMSSLCLLKGGGTFKSAIAVAPVTNWKWYDTIYTERYMRTEEENPDGYRDNSPVNFAHLLSGDYLLVHGGSDDNVHFQHSAEMAKELIKANKQFDTYYYTNRDHGIHGDHARLHLYTKMTNFLKETIGTKAAPADKSRS